MGPPPLPPPRGWWRRRPELPEAPRAQTLTFKEDKTPAWQLEEAPVNAVLGRGRRGRPWGLLACCPHIHPW